MTVSACRQRPEGCERIGGVVVGLEVPQQIGLARLLQHPARVEARLRVDGRRPGARRRRSRPRSARRASRRTPWRSTAPRPAAAAACGCCTAAFPSSTALRSPDSRLAAIARAGSAATTPATGRRQSTLLGDRHGDFSQRADPLAGSRDRLVRHPHQQVVVGARARPTAGSRAWSHAAAAPTATDDPCAGTSPPAARGRSASMSCDRHAEPRHALLRRIAAEIRLPQAVVDVVRPDPAHELSRAGAVPPACSPARPARRSPRARAAASRAASACRTYSSASGQSTSRHCPSCLSIGRCSRSAACSPS